MIYTRVRPLVSTQLSDFCLPMFDKKLSPADTRDALLHLVKNDEAAFLQRLPQALQAIMHEAVSDQRRLRDGRSYRRGSASRRAYVLPKVEFGDGHAAAVAAFACVPPAQQTDLIAEYRLARFVLAGFVGTGASVSEAAHERLLGGQGNLRGVRNIPRPLPEDIIRYNAELFAADAPMAGKQLLGNNGWAQVVGHWRAQGSGIAWQAVMMVTTDIHSQDGLVLWVMARLPEFPEGFAWLSLHAGEHPVPMADTVNAFLAPLLLHPTFERGMYIAQLYPEICREFGELAPQLTLNPRIRTWLKAREYTDQPRRRVQNIFLDAMDKTGGYLLAQARNKRLKLTQPAAPQ